MRTELIIRAGFNDHVAVSDAVASAPERVGPPFSRLVVDAHIAPRRPEIAETAARAGVPLLIDPLTIFGQARLREDDPWLALPFAEQARRISDLGERDVDALVEQVVDFELAHGASAIIPPYIHVGSPSEGTWMMNLTFIRRTARFLRRNDVDVPVVPILSGPLYKIGAGDAARAIEGYSAAVAELNLQFVALALSPVGRGDEGVGKLLSLFTTSLRLRRRHRCVAWRQGVYGAALVAAGLDGYETGAAIGEQCDVARTIASRGRKSEGGVGPGVYLEPLRRSYTSVIAQILFADDDLRARLMCLDPHCCPDGATSSLTDKKGHAMRARARQLEDFRTQPHRQWRLHHVEREARSAVTVTERANRLLEAAGEKRRLRSKGLTSLIDVAQVLREQTERGQVA